MAGISNRLFLVLLKILMYAKRGVFFTGRVIGPGLLRGSSWLIKNLGFHGYRAAKRVERHLDWKTIPLASRLKEFFTSQGFLYIVILACAIFFVFGQTRLHAQSFQTQPGGDAPLIAMLGPEEEFFVEVFSAREVDYKDQPQASAILRNSFAALGTGDRLQALPDLATLAPGGGALTKPSIFTGVSATGARTEVITYIVLPGDTISSIAQKFGISTQTVLWENNLSLFSLIRPGQTLSILPVSGVRHKIKKGETLARIAKTYKVNEEEILKFNSLAGADQIKVGDILVIPGGVRQSVRQPASRVRFVTDGVVGGTGGASSLEAGTRKFIWPTSVRRITQYFSWRHSGLDIAGPAGTPVYASRTGRVISSACGWQGGYGCNIRIDHGDGFITLYAHNSRNFVRAGDFVEQGQHIANMGSTGRSTGSHVHFEVRSGGRKFNPLQFVR